MSDKTRKITFQEVVSVGELLKKMLEKHGIEATVAAGGIREERNRVGAGDLEKVAEEFYAFVEADVSSRLNSSQR